LLDFEMVGVLEAIEKLNSQSLSEKDDSSINIESRLILQIIPRIDILTCQLCRLGDNSANNAVLTISRLFQKDTSLEVRMIDNLRKQIEKIGKDNKRTFICHNEVIDLFPYNLKQKLIICTSNFFDEFKQLVDQRLVFCDGDDFKALEDGFGVCQVVDKCANDYFNEILKEGILIIDILLISIAMAHNQLMNQFHGLQEQMIFHMDKAVLNHHGNHIR
jgi:hypothetical protein